MTVSGNYNFPDFMEYIKIIRDKCEEEKIYKLLMDLLMVENIDVPTMERFFLGVEEAERLKSKIKLSVVGNKKYINHFFETVAVNRGGDVGVFGNTDHAVDWLLNGISE